MSEAMLAKSDESYKEPCLTKEEIEEGYFWDIILGKCNIKKASNDRNEAIRSEYEAFDRMHVADGIFVKSKRSSDL